MIHNEEPEYHETDPDPCLCCENLCGAIECQCPCHFTVIDADIKDFEGRYR